MSARFRLIFSAAVAMTFLANVASADVTIFSENFDSFTSGQSLNGPDWNPKWDGTNDTTQQNLFTGDGNGGACLDLTLAKLNYHSPAQTAFTVNAGDTIRIESQFQLTHNGMGGPANVNENTVGFLLTQNPQWWSGPNKDFSIAARGGAIGNRLPAAPWIENWVSYNLLGIDINAGVDQVSDWFTMTMTLTVNGAGNIEGTMNYYNANFNATSTPVDIGWAAGTTLYSGYTTAWNDMATNTIEQNSNFSKMTVDNFAIIDATPVPEPTSLMALAGLGLGLFVRRRR